MKVWQVLGLAVLIAVQTSSSAYAVSYAGAQLKPSGWAGGQNFGWSVAISGDTVVIGAVGDDEVGENVGAVYVFERLGRGNECAEVKKLFASDAAEYAFFGESVAIDGDTIAVGARGDSEGGLGSGAAYVFDRDEGGGDNWGQVAKLVASDAAEGDLFGSSISIDGDTVVVGAYANEDAGDESGSAYLFARNQGGVGNWGQIKKLAASDASEGDRFGWSVAVAGDIVAVGAYADADLGANSGSVYLFERDRGGGDNWGEVKKIFASDQVIYDRFGWSVALDANRLVVGMFGDDDPYHKCGSAYIFERNRGGADNWGEVVKLNAADAGAQDYFGWSVGLDGDRVVVGARLDDHVVPDAGSAYIFERNEGGLEAWGEVAKIVAPDAASGDEFGAAVAVFGQTVVVGGWGNSDVGPLAGSAYVFVPGLLLPTMPAWGLSVLGLSLTLAGGLLASTIGPKRSGGLRRRRDPAPLPRRDPESRSRLP